jgi:DNA-binding transcriptional ArsR family regulator
MDKLQRVFFALSDPTRRAILVRLAQGEATVLELAAPFAISQPAISRHLKLLEEAGLVTRRVEGARRPCRLAPGGLAQATEWLGALGDASPVAPETAPEPGEKHGKKKKKARKHGKAKA